MASTEDSNVCIDPDFVALRNHRRVSGGRQFPTLSGGEQADGRPSCKKGSVHVRFEEEPVSAKYSKAESMSSTTGSSVYIDPLGPLGPLARPVLNRTSTIVEPHSPELRPHRSRSSVAASLDHDINNEDNADPWNFPKLLPSTTQAAMTVIEDHARGRALTKRQLGAIRKIVSRPPQCAAEGQSKPIQPPSHRLVLDIAPLGSNYAPSEVSENPSHQKAKSAWNYPKLEARPQKSVSRPNINEKRKSKVQKPYIAVDVMPEFMGGFGDLESNHSEPEVILEPAPKPQKKQKGKKDKQNGGQNNQQAQKNATQSKKQSKKQAEKEPPEEEFDASQLYGGYNGGASTERAQLPTELKQQSPTPSAKFAGWDMAPHSPPPLGPVDPPTEDDWDAPELLGETGSRRESKGSQRSGHSHRESPQAGSSRSHRSQHDSQKMRSSPHLNHSHHESRKTLSIAAGSVAWVEPDGIASAGAEIWADNPVASVHGSHQDSDRRSKKTTSRHSGSRRGSMFAGDLPLDTIFEDAPLESVKNRSSRHSQATKSDGRQSKFKEDMDDHGLDEKPASRQSSGSKRSHDHQSRSGEVVNDWDMNDKPASKSGSGSHRSGSHRSRSGEVADEWEMNGKPASKQGSRRSGSVKSRTDELVGDWDQPEKPASKQSSASGKSGSHRSRSGDVVGDWGQPEKSISKQGSHRSDGHHSRHSEAVDNWDQPEKPTSKQGSYRSDGHHSRQGEVIDNWDQPEQSVSKQGSYRSDGHHSRQGEAVDTWDQPEKPASKQGSYRSDSYHSRQGEAVDTWDQPEQPASKQGSYRSDGHHSSHSEAVNDWDQPEKSDGHHSRHSEAVNDWDQPEKSVSRQGSHSNSGGRQSRQNSTDWDQPAKSSSKHGSKSSSRHSKHNEDDNGGGWDVSRQGSVIGGSQVGWETKTSSDTHSHANEGWEEDGPAPPKHESGSRSHRTESHRSSSQSKHGVEQENGRDSRHQSHRSGSGSQKISSNPRVSVSRSPSKKGTVTGSYIAPLVEEDPENWHGWEADGEKSRSKSRSHKSQSEAAVDEWIQGSTKAGSFKAGSVKGHTSPAMALSIGSTATSTTSLKTYASSSRNDPIEAWGEGKVPRDSSVGTRFGRNSPAGSGFGAPTGSAAAGWSQSGRVEERQLSKVDGPHELLMARANLLVVMDQLERSRLEVDGILKLLLRWRLRESLLGTVLVIEGLRPGNVRKSPLDAVLVIEQSPINGLGPVASKVKLEKAVGNPLDRALVRVLDNAKSHP
ncbi:hypothetical protein BLS_003993 [Venturia inaequalis]|uniref:Uncharacterized protein n=1 Tax=Venturia inaequalis TaxID=5025 RepID=A0A8H3V9H9_VENIN|nr:hypothetical protein BLS_003993 [Venturia inaequalis]